MRRRRWSLGGTVVLLAVLAASACADGGGDASAPTSSASARPSFSPASPAASPPVEEIAERAALAAYRGMWEDWVRLAETSDYQNPDLARHVSGDALSLIYKSIYLNQSHGVVSRGNPVLQPRVTSVSPSEVPDQAVIEDCVDDSNWLNYRADGQREDDERGGRRRTQALALEKAGVWKIDRLVVQTVGTC